jgi:triacylglycerol esterase/lipase EstA (alpha/beta hydrolase family)
MYILSSFNLFTLVSGCAGINSSIEKNSFQEEAIEEPVVEPHHEEAADTAPPDTVQEETTDEECGLEGGSLPYASEGAFLVQNGSVQATRSHCLRNIHAAAGAKSSVLSLQLEEWDGEDSAVIEVSDLRMEPISSAQLAKGDQLDFVVPQSGEFFISVSPLNDHAAGNQYSISLACQDGCGLLYTRYPIVYMHGLAGFDTLLNFLDYWANLSEEMPAAGYHVEIHAVNAFDPTVERANQWVAILDSLDEEGVGRKFNIVGHSQGGLDARYIASVLEEATHPSNRIASITTISSPHHGTLIGDVLTGVVDLSPFDGFLIDGVTEAAASIFGLEGDDLTTQAEQMSTQGMQEFNEVVPDIEGIYYSSWAGRTCPITDILCQLSNSGEVVSSLFVITHAFLNLAAGPNDGLVTVESAQWGEFMGEIPADHIDEVGVQLDIYSSPFEHESFYLGEAARLFELGL